MDDKTVKLLIYKSAFPPLKYIVSKNIKNSEQLDNETRIIIDLNIVYYEIRNSIELILDYLVDRFKILDKDTLTKNIIIHIYNYKVKECILKINKIIPTENLSKIESELDSNPDEKNKYLIKYLVDELIKCIFTPDIINMILELAEDKSNNLFNILEINWKIIVILFVLILISLLIRKSYLYFKKK